jgi:hypothetical protein
VTRPESFKLPVVVEVRTLKRGHHDRRGAFPSRLKGDRRALFVVHRHVAAHSVALLPNRGHRVGGRISQRGRERVQLHNVLPGLQVRVASFREHPAGDSDERVRLRGELRLTAGNEAFRPGAPGPPKRSSTT